MSRLVAVSNRISVPRRGAAPGGLAVGLLAAMQARRGLWFGWDGETAETPADEPSVVRKDGVTFASIDFDQAEYKDFYLGFCNGTLWPLFHYFVDGFRYNDVQYEAYQRMNQRYARQLVPLLEPNDLIWVHDYHLFPLAQKLREAGANQPMGLFLHIPFPNIEVLRVLPVYGELLQAMLAYDVLGFQTEPDRDAFRSAVASMWGEQTLTSDHTVTLGDRRVVTGVFPIGVDVDAIQREAVESQNTDACKRMLAGLLGRRLMIGVDRLDYSKGLVERFKAYERFLETHPGEPEPRDLPADRAAVAQRRARLRRDPPRSRTDHGPHQRPLRRHRLDADPVPQPQFPARRAHGLHAFGAHRHRHAGARRHEPGGEGVRGGAGSGRSRRADPVDPGRRRARAQHGGDGESLRLTRHGACHPAGIQHADCREARTPPGDDRRAAEEFDHRLAHELRRHARVGGPARVPQLALKAGGRIRAGG